MGSGYGGKHSVDAAVEAAKLAKAVGKPVRVAWTREEEFTWAYFRPAGVIEVNAGAKKDGTLTVWEFANYNSGPSAIRTPYSCANAKTDSHSSQAPLRQGRTGSWRPPRTTSPASRSWTNWPMQSR